MANPAVAWGVKAMSTSQIPLKLEWRLTWSEADDDYSAVADGYDGFIGRIYKDGRERSDELWAWSMTAHGYDISRVGQLHGYETSARDAAHMVEGAWFRAIVGSAVEMSRIVSRYPIA